MISYSTMFLHIACCFCDKGIAKNESQVKLVLIFCHLSKKFVWFGLIWFEIKPTSPLHPCPTTFNCGVVFGFKVMRFTLSRLLSSAMFA